MKCLLILLALLGSLASAQPADPPELQQLRGAYQQRAMRAMQPVNDRFLRQLQDLLRRYHGDGRLGDAVAVQHRLAALTGEEPVPGTPSDPPLGETLHDTAFLLTGDRACSMFTPDFGQGPGTALREERCREWGGGELDE